MSGTAVQSYFIRLPDGVELPADLAIPPQAVGCVVFVHGSGSSRLSPRNRLVSGVLNDAGIATLLFDLLTPEEAEDRRNVFDIGLLAGRLLAATRWLEQQPEVEELPLGFFGASTGAAAALRAAAVLGERARAVVSRGGRPDLAGPILAEVQCPTLLIVGGNDEVVLALNREALGKLTGESELLVIPGATHLFEEPGALEEVALLAREWFVAHLGPPDRVVRPPHFADREDAGRLLAETLAAGSLDLHDAVVVGLARGGAVPAAAIAEQLGLELDVLAVRKVGYPGHPEYAIGAVTPGGGVYVREAEGLPAELVEAVVADARTRADELDAGLHAADPSLDLSGRTVVLTDDGLATGATMIAAVRWARQAGAARIVVAVPIGPEETVAALAAEVDEVVCPVRPRLFGAVGLWYERFAPVSDAEVVELLRERRGAPGPSGRPGSRRAATGSRSSTR